MSPADHDKFGADVCAMANELLASRGKNASLSLSDDVRDMQGGIILVDGKIEINCSLEALVNSCRDELTGDVAKILFD